MCLPPATAAFKRLASAAMTLIRLHAPGNDLPKNLHEELNSLMHELTKEPAHGNEGTIVTTTKELSTQEAKELAERILSIYTKLMAASEIVPYKEPRALAGMALNPPCRFSN
jgi:hypothetical protein